MASRKLLALLPAALATVLVPSASAAEYATQRCTENGPANVATIYTVMGTRYRTDGAMDYTFADVNSSPEGIEICVRYQQFVGGYGWEGIYVLLPGNYSVDGTVEVDNAVASCPDEVVNETVEGNQVRVATEETANSNAVCVTLGTTSIRVNAVLNGPSALPVVEEDPVTSGSVYGRSPQFGAGGTESGQCTDIPQIGSTYVTTPNSHSFLRREFDGSLCFRVDRPGFHFGGRVDTFTVAVFNYAELTNAQCDVTLFETTMPPPRDIRIKQSSGLGSSDPGYLCAKVNGTEVQLKVSESHVPPVPTLHFDA